MKDLFDAGKLLLLDMASTLFFIAVFLVTGSISISVALGVAMGIVQIGLKLVRKKPIVAIEWMSIVLVVGSGAATLMTNDIRIVLLKPSLIYIVVGLVLLKRGWMNRYLPPVANALVPDVATLFGYLWAALMFVSAVLNVIVALYFSVEVWSWFMTGFAIFSKLALFLIGYGTMRYIGTRRWHAMPTLDQDKLMAALGQ